MQAYTIAYNTAFYLTEPYAHSTEVSAEKSPQKQASRAVNISKPVQDRVSLIQQITTPKPARVSVCVNFSWTSFQCN